MATDRARCRGAAVGSPSPCSPLLAYVPALASSPGRMPADTKLYLYLDPGRLITDAPWTFDARQFAGWVPHQVIAYLWPQGPWYWLGDDRRAPGLGHPPAVDRHAVPRRRRRRAVDGPPPRARPRRRARRRARLPAGAVPPAVRLADVGDAAAVGRARLDRRAHRRSPPRRPGGATPRCAALVVATVGAVNATALLMIAPAPVLWLLVAAAERRITWRRAGATAARIGGLSLGVSLWWIAMVVIQGRRGADVLAYSESLESVSYTSTSTEVWRGLGYWLTYVRDAYAATTTAGARLHGVGPADRHRLRRSSLVGLAGLVAHPLARTAASPSRSS